MTGIDRCSRCHEPLGEGIRRAIVTVCYPENPANPPLHTLPKMLCKKCMDSFFEWKDMGFLDWKEVRNERRDKKEAKE